MMKMDLLSKYWKIFRTRKTPLSAFWTSNTRNTITPFCPNLRIYPKKKVKKISRLEKNGGYDLQNEDKEEISSSKGVSGDDGQRTDNSHYPDMKPPSSPTPSKP
ncbi:rhodanese-like domain-containing protein 4A chloroplastic [Tripterygium wilfordii]|uniref:Rhodanese-like domain-containing protein 4A chloroplastic n=1 Tax=Tripterygium wilfordii TaxID=458696 RepID=A0A7J7BX75_TRIWF|nr:rhodanese-like domain-containing protein 4A chloroplastic [Tripterygium wilfordii]